MSSKQFVITNGPGKWDFALALFEEGKTVRFTVRTTSETVVRSCEFFVISAESMDKKRAQFLITLASQDAYFTGDEDRDCRIKFSGYYDLSCRRGNLEIED
ncbi:hypothetical protein H6761_02865 [Candidatus Nomurabacteria bacterium]|nr:hypothetical protein [Candidatus Nomurabacteria bacterium]